VVEPRVIALPMGEFTFPEAEEYAGETGVVVAYAIRHAGGTFLFDTGFGFGEAWLDDYYQVRANRLPAVLDAAGVALGEITAVANCHLHADHAGQNALFPGVPIHVQPAEWHAAHEPDYTIVDWIDFDGATYVEHAGDHEVAPGIRIYATPGHSPGHQSVVVETRAGALLLAGQGIGHGGRQGHGEQDTTTMAGSSPSPDPFLRSWRPLLRCAGRRWLRA